MLWSAKTLDCRRCRDSFVDPPGLPDAYHIALQTMQPVSDACAICSELIADPAERWPGVAGGTVCQVCWETESSRSWWAMVRLLPSSSNDAAAAS